MATTAENLILEAYGLSRKNTPGEIADEVGELIPQINRSLRRYFAAGARINPEFFARNTFNVPFTGGGWARPESALSIHRIEAGMDAQTVASGFIPPGTRIRTVPFDQRWAEAMVPAVYHHGQRYYPAGNPPDPVSGELVFWFAKTPNTLSHMGSVVDHLWPEQHNALLVLDLGLYLARKDGNRDDELAHLQAEKQEELQAFTTFLEHTDVTETRVYGAPATIVTPATQVVP